MSDSSTANDSPAAVFALTLLLSLLSEKPEMGAHFEGNSMFKISKKGENRLDIEMSGKLDVESMKVALDELVAKSEGIENGKMLYVVIDFRLPTVGAIAIEFSRLPSMLGLMNKFDRAAVLTDRTWLKKVSEFEGTLYPGLEIRAFNIADKAEAEAWLSS